MTTRNTPKVGEAVIIDIGEASDIHPKNKEDVGKRLALAAEAIGYGMNVVYSGPAFDSMSVEGNAARLKFKHLGGGLLAKGDQLKGFAVAGEDGKFVWGDAKIDGDTIVVTSEQVAKPIAVRYGWRITPNATCTTRKGSRPRRFERMTGSRESRRRNNLIRQYQGRDRQYLTAV